MPLILHRQALLQAGLTVSFFHRPSSSLTDCDALLLDGKYYSPRWVRESAQILEEITDYRERVRNLIYVDLLDSAGWDHARALPHVALYCKSQLLRDRSAYLEPLYGYRAFADYYHQTAGVDDDQPVVSEPAADPAHLDKLMVSWNSGLADYSWLGPYRMIAYRYVPLRALLRFPDFPDMTASPRRNDVSCRMGTKYIRDSVSYQRRKLAEILKSRMRTDKLSRREFIAELRDSKIVLSPFGYGEITLRDFEIFMNGALMLKPDMSGIETWPDLYRDGETMVAHRWDLSDVESKIEEILSDYDSYTDIAMEGHRRYREHLSGPEAEGLFAERLSRIIEAGERKAR